MRLSVAVVLLALLLVVTTVADGDSLLSLTLLLR